MVDLKKCQKNKIINDVFKGDSNSDWSILIYDQSTAKIMTNLFTQSELITHNIVLSQRIEEKREKADFPVVYFVLCTKENLKIINQEFEEKQYNSFRVCFLGDKEGDGINNMNNNLNSNNNINLNNNNNMNTNNLNFNYIFLNFVALEDKLFLSSIPDIYSVANTLNLNFYVEFTLKSLEFECKKLNESFGEDRNSKIIIFDRSLDLFTPLGHFFTFQAFLNDIKENENLNEEGDSNLWKEIRYAHLGELNDIFKTFAHDISINMKKLEGNIDTKELMKMVLSAPETLKMNEMLKKYFELAGECYEAFENISFFIEKEQIILTGFDKLKNKSKLGFNDLLEIFEKQNIDHSDKLHIYHLFRFSGYEFRSEEKRKLKEFGFKDEELNSKNEQNYKYFKPLKYNYKYDYDVSRYEPTVSVILREYLVKNKKLIEIFKLKKEKSQFKSLRKSYLLSVKPEINKKKIYIVYIKGGVTYPEIASIHKLTEILGTEILIGSDRVIRPREFVKEM